MFAFNRLVPDKEGDAWPLVLFEKTLEMRLRFFDDGAWERKAAELSSRTSSLSEPALLCGGEASSSSVTASAKVSGLGFAAALFASFICARAYCPGVSCRAFSNSMSRLRRSSSAEAAGSASESSPESSSSSSSPTSLGSSSSSIPSSASASIYCLQFCPSPPPSSSSSDKGSSGSTSSTFAAGNAFGAGGTTPAPGKTPGLGAAG
mmetsp:Transcript_92144/g.192653  ORF Transcript_92144/g.192653 Transcript_92144/m.192653 type:complete len:206 (+) Transcript_92144:1231-1848(+)